MNKTIIININGIVFHIEENAYELLKAYMGDVKRHFAYSPDSDEIVGDIESRIAEMFSENLLADKKQVIEIDDVEQVTAQMGAVNEFAEADEPAFTEQPLTIQKKLYRDIDDRIIGGVCAGIAHYFDIKTRIVRLIALLILFIGGSGLLIYAILWLIMPKAVTRADKMAMKGEPINLQNFKRNFDAEVEALRSNFTRSNNGAGPIGSFFRNIFDLLTRIFGGLLKVAVKVAGGFIILFGTIALIATIIGLFIVLGIGHSNALDHFPFIVINPEYMSALFFSAFVLIVIPIIALVLFAIRIMFDRKVLTKTGSFAMLIIWLTGLVVGTYYGSRLASEFSESASFEQTTTLQAMPAYKLELNYELTLSKEDSIEYGLEGNIPNRRITTNGEDEYEVPRNVKLDIERSDVSAPVLIQEFSARGTDFKNALKHAQRISYHCSQTDSTLKFDRLALIPRGELWRNPEMRLKLLVPANTRLHIDGKLNRYIQDYDLNDCIPDDMPYDSFSEWIMTDTGLKCKNESLYYNKQNR